MCKQKFNLRATFFCLSFFRSLIFMWLHNNSQTASNVCKINKCLTFAKHLHAYFCRSGKETNCNKIKETKLAQMKLTPSASTQICRRPPEKASFGVVCPLTFSFGSRFMVFSGRRTRRTRSDLIVLMSLPLVPLQGMKGTRTTEGTVWSSGH